MSLEGVQKPLPQTLEPTQWELGVDGPQAKPSATERAQSLCQLLWNVEAD